MVAPTTKAKDDRWARTSCGGCYAQCGIRAPVVDGTVVDLEGNPNTPAGSRRICAKGTAQLMTLYGRHRVNYPVKRTNLEKGVGVDPKGRRITWDEALDTIVDRFDKMKDPRGRLSCGMRGVTAGCVGRDARTWASPSDSAGGLMGVRTGCRLQQPALRVERRSDDSSRL